MGVLGVAVATLISRIVAGIIMKLLLLSKRNRFRITTIKMYRPSISLVKKILSIGIPRGIENGMFQIGKLLVVSMVATLGTDAIAANAIGYQIIDFPNIPGMSIRLALVVIVGQDIGAGDKELAVRDSKYLLKLAYIGDWTCKILLFAVAPEMRNSQCLSVYYPCGYVESWLVTFLLCGVVSGYLEFGSECLQTGMSEGSAIR